MGEGIAQLLVLFVIIGGFYYLVRRHHLRKGESREERNERLRARLLATTDDDKRTSSDQVRGGGKSGKTGKSGAKSATPLDTKLFKVEEFVKFPPTNEEMFLVSDGGRYKVVSVTHHSKQTNMTYTAGNPHIWLVFLELREEYR